MLLKVLLQSVTVSQLQSVSYSQSQSVTVSQSVRPSMRAVLEQNYLIKDLSRVHVHAQTCDAVLHVDSFLFQVCVCACVWSP